MSSNLVTTVTLTDIIMLIHQIPLVSNEIKGGNLDTRFKLRFDYPFTSKRWNFDLAVNARQIVIWLKEILEIEPNSIQEINISDQSNFEHFIDTIRENYETDTDVRELFENPILQN